ncbi:antitoxin VbhA family protein [Proteiniborus sp. MB09-C3]|uniref:antitoxin VbhA family protein n=1 Tax=Proteiniborus sp. MB09-C3 TaxID=3050072 RepID=UPI0025573A93|nr:antitoxin VbhA family protein [Proteiniborus sp. MB09-C3]WIV12697.1 antitoxin VbhA family protein [Proteiniborus sp. MB09-C3]
MDNDKAWEYALGMIKIDGLEPSKEYLELIEKEKRGEITTDDIRKVLDKKYRVIERGKNV